MSLPTYRQPSEPSGMLVSHTPVGLAARAARFRTVMIRRIIGLVFSAVISVIYYLLWRPTSGTLLFWLLIGSVIYSALLLGWAITQLVWTRRLAARVPPGPAFRIDTRGVVVASNPMGERFAWPQARLVAGRNKWFNPGPRLEFAWETGFWSVPIITLDTPPATIDSALRAFSLGRFGLDLSSVDDIW